MQEQHYTTSELVQRYGVSDKAVRNWIVGANAGKFGLKLRPKDGRFYIARTAQNDAIIAGLVESGRKHRNRRFKAELTPSAKFYELYSPEQVLDIFKNLDAYREIPLQYSYFDAGADYWDRYANRLQDELVPNLLNRTEHLLRVNQGYFDDLVRQCKTVNVIDIGAGNALPVRGLLEHLSRKGVLGEYLAIDISPDLLEVARRNLTDWFGRGVKFNADLRDVSCERFDDVFTRPPFSTQDEDVINLVLFLGGTLSNFRAPGDVLTRIRSSMSPRDLLVHTLKLDTPVSRRFFDFSASDVPQALAENHRLILDLLNLTDDLYDVESGFDLDERSRYIRARLKVDVTVVFEIGDGQRRLELNNGETILLWRYRHQDAVGTIQEFAASGFNVLQASQTPDHEYLLLVSDISTGR